MIIMDIHYRKLRSEVLLHSSISRHAAEWGAVQRGGRREELWIVTCAVIVI